MPLTKITAFSSLSACPEEKRGVLKAVLRNKTDGDVATWGGVHHSSGHEYIAGYIDARLSNLRTPAVEAETNPYANVSEYLRYSELSLEARSLVQRPVFLIKSTSSSTTAGSGDGSHHHSYIGMGVCVTPNCAVTLTCNLQDADLHSKINIFFPGTGNTMSVSIGRKNDALGYAVLVSSINFPQHLPLYRDEPIALVGETMAICPCYSRRDIQSPQQQLEPVTHTQPIQAHGVRLCKHKCHLVYLSPQLHSAPGTPLVLFDGHLAGLHVGTETLKHSKCKVACNKGVGQQVSTGEQGFLEPATQSMGTSYDALLSEAMASDVLEEQCKYSVGRNLRDMSLE